MQKKEGEIEGSTVQYSTVQYSTVQCSISYVTYTWCDRAVSSEQLSSSHARSGQLP